MTKRDKLVQRFLSEPPEIDLEDVRNLLEMFGYTERKGSASSHHSFVSSGKDRITVATVSGRMVKRTYIRLIIRALDLQSYLEK